ncbi:MAG: hypothetical protein AAB766_04135 [Patescibacteria group bacterium]
MLPEQFKSLKLISECPVCRQKQFSAEIKLIEERPSGQLLHVQCKSCQSCLVVFMSFNEQGINMLGVLTDLASEEVSKFFQRGPLVADDVLNARAEIVDGDFIKKLMTSVILK